MAPRQREGHLDRSRKIRRAGRREIGQHWITLNQGPQQIPVVELDQGLLLYRADNGRLLAELGQRFAGRSLQLEGLKQQEESTETQKLLHELLITKAADPKGPILEELRRLAVQTEPLLADASGVVINGNRRLSAMRELLKENPERYHRFQKPQVAVLPKEISREDLEYLETALQLAPETKLPYGWVERRLKLRHQTQELKLDASWVKGAYRMDSKQQIKLELAELALLESYLEDWHGTSCDYKAAAGSEYLFEALNKQLDNLDGPARRLWTVIGLLLINQRKELPATADRLYPFAPASEDDIPLRILQRLAEDLAIVNGDNSRAPKKPEMRALMLRINKTQDPKGMAMRVLGLIEEAQEQHRKDRVPGRILKNLQQSNRLIEKLETELMSGRERDQLLGEAAAIKSRLEALLSARSVGHQSQLQKRWRLGRWLSRLIGGI